MYSLYYLMHKDTIVCSVSISDDGSYREHRVFGRMIKTYILKRGYLRWVK